MEVSRGKIVPDIEKELILSLLLMFFSELGGEVIIGQ